jgi:drug/metabolite transporter (DMT)-like permease
VNRVAVGLLAVVVMVWGANWPIMAIGLTHIQPLWFAALRLAMGILCFAVVLVPQGRLRLPHRGDWPVVASIGLLQMAVFMGLINTALQWVPPGRSAILAYTTPLWVAPGAALFLGERLTAGRLTGLALGLAGVAVLFNPIGFDWSDTKALAGNGLLLLAALVWAGTILHVRGHCWLSPPLDLAPWQMGLGLVPLAVMAWLVEGPPRADASAQFLAVAAYNGPLATAFAYWAAVTVNRMMPALTVSLAFLCVPVAGLLFSAASTGERMTATNLVGLALIGGGVAVVVVTGRKPA